jgi:putative ATPase
MTSPVDDADHRPLAERRRPRCLAEFCGQDHLLGPGMPLRVAIEKGHPHSMVLWGPPGSGKTTLAGLIAQYCKAQCLSLSAVLAGVKELREAVAKAQTLWRNERRRTVLFVDEMHRFNKAQQDAFLHAVEDGTLIFIGATTENPSFALNSALLSRVRVYVLRALEPEQIRLIIDQALADGERGLGGQAISLEEEQRNLLAGAADGDARRALTLLELTAEYARSTAAGMDLALTEVLKGGLRRFDKGGDIFYDQISALHKSVRGSNPDAALYWYARLLDGGCDPRYLARRVVRMASEDIGNADPRALRLALDAWESYERLGSPEGELALAQAISYLACAPKSNAVYIAFETALAEARQGGSLEVPLHLRNAPTQLMKQLGHGKDYRYPHDEAEAYAAGETYFPEKLGERRYYRPAKQGLEIKIGEKLAHWRQLDEAARAK